MAAAEGAPKQKTGSTFLPQSDSDWGRLCFHFLLLAFFGGRADSQLDLTRAYRNIVRFSPSLLATHIAASCFWGWEEPRLRSQQPVAGPCHSIFVTGATATRKSNRSRTVARFQSSLNQTPCLGGACALGMCALVENNLKNIGTANMCFGRKTITSFTVQ